MIKQFINDNCNVLYGLTKYKKKAQLLAAIEKRLKL